MVFSRLLGPSKASYSEINFGRWRLRQEREALVRETRKGDTLIDSLRKHEHIELSACGSAILKWRDLCGTDSNYASHTPTLSTPPPLSTGSLCSRQFRSHQETKMAARRTQRSTSTISRKIGVWSSMKSAPASLNVNGVSVFWCYTRALVV